MTPEQRATQLTIAASSVANVLNDLDVSKVHCTACDLEHFVNWHDANVAKQLQGIINKLQRFAKEERENA